MRDPREKRIDEPRDSNGAKNGEKLPASTIGEVRSEIFEVANVFEEGLGAWLYGHDAVEGAAQEQGSKNGVKNEQYRSNEVHLIMHTFRSVICRDVCFAQRRQGEKPTITRLTARQKIAQ
jgi:hypothetical protein